MAENLVVKVVAETRDALKKLKGVDGGAKEAGKAFLGLGKAVGVAAVAFGGLAVAKKVGVFLKDSTRLALVQEEAERKLATALGRTSQELLTYASALQKKTTFGDEEILSAQAMIANFIKEEDQIKKLTPAILDLATAKGMSLTAAADLVTKSVSSSTNAMTRYGIEIEGAAGSTERIDSAVTNLTAAFGGMAEGMAKTNAGQLKQMDNEIGDLKEKVGDELLPAMIGIKNATLSFYKVILHNSGGAIEAIGKISTAVSDALLTLDFLLFKEKEDKKNIEMFDRYQSKYLQLGKSAKEWTEEVEFFNQIQKDGTKLTESQIKWVDGLKKSLDGVGAKRAEALEQMKKYAGVQQLIIDRSKETTTSLKSEEDQLRELTIAYNGSAIGYEKWLEDRIRGGGELLKSRAAALKAQQNEISDKKFEELQAQNQEELQIEQNKQDAMHSLRQTAVSSALDIANSISAIGQAQAQQEIQQLNANMKAEIGSRNMSGRARTAIEKKYSKEREKIQKEQAEKNRKLQVAQALVGLAQGVAGIWSQDLGRMGSFGIPFAIGTSALLAGTAAAQIGAMKAQAFADGGIVQKESGVSATGDNHVIRVNPGEEILTANDPRHRNNNGGGNVTNINIAGDVTSEQLQKVEDILYELESNNRISIFN